MKPPKFDYSRPSTVAEALQMLAAANGDAKILAGGQSLVPMLNFRLLNPALLIDINRIAELQFLRERPDGGLAIGALTRHHTLETSPLVKRLFPMLSAAMAHVAHLAIRNRGTIGGSITHADPATELPLMMKLLDARIRLESVRGARTLDPDQFFLGSLTSAAEEDELVTEIELPGLPAGAGWAFEEVARRAGDFALAAVGVILVVEGGKIAEARVAVAGVDDTQLRIDDAETILYGETCDQPTLDAVVEAVRATVQPTTDLHVSADYRRHLVGVLVRRALADAWRRANGETL